jgi:hypothetical protein
VSVSEFWNIRFWESQEQVVGYHDRRNHDKENPKREEDGSALTVFGFRRSESQAHDQQIRESAKSNFPKQKGGILEIDCGCRFPKRKIEDPFRSSSGQWKGKDPVLTWTFQPAGCGGSMRHQYLEWKPNILLLLKSRGLYKITMETTVEPDSIDEKNDFLNIKDMAIGFIFLSISPKILHQVYEESQESTPNELQTRLEVLFGNKEYCEDFMQEVEEIELE